VLRLVSRVAQVTGQYQNELATRLRDASHRDDEAVDKRIASDPVVKFYDRSTVVRITDSMRLDASTQRTNAGEVRKALVGQLSGTQSFSKLDEMMSIGTLRDVIDRTCTEFSKASHDTAAKSEQQRVLGVNIIKKLRERYDGDDDG